MPTIDENRRNWDDRDAWKQHGEEWSQAWGSSDRMWLGSILPRIAPFLPADHLLEIACGHGRVTAYLLEHCRQYTGVDLAPSCVDACRERFEGRAETRFEVTDGQSLPGIAEASIDLAFSWDSLVHADRTALEGYVAALARVLRIGGVAFLHHSNLAAFIDERGELRITNPHWRDTTVSAELVRELALGAGLDCRSQELVQWGTGDVNDCFTLLRRSSGGGGGETEVVTHPDFGAEMALFRHIESIYPSRSRTPETRDRP